MLATQFAQLNLGPHLPQSFSKIKEQTKVRIAQFVPEVSLLSIEKALQCRSVKQVVYATKGQFFSRGIDQHIKNLPAFLDLIPTAAKTACTKLYLDYREETTLKMVVDAFPNLKDFQFGLCMTDSVLAQIARLTKLEKLQIGCVFDTCTDIGLQQLAKLTNLKTLRIPIANIQNGDVLLQNLKGCSLLSELHIGNCRSMTHDGLASIAHLPIAKMNLSGCTVNDTCLGILRSMWTLQSLDLKWCTTYTTTGLLWLKSRNIDVLHDPLQPDG